jgi:hypothetical protein
MSKQKLGQKTKKLAIPIAKARIKATGVPHPDIQ